MATTYRCPLCGSSLTKAKFEQVTNIQAERAKALHEAHRREEALRRQVGAMRRQVKRAKEEGKAEEKRRSGRLVQGLQKKLNVAQDRIRQLEKGTHLKPRAWSSKTSCRPGSEENFHRTTSSGREEVAMSCTPFSLTASGPVLFFTSASEALGSSAVLSNRPYAIASSVRRISRSWLPQAQEKGSRASRGKAPSSLRLP